MLAEAVNKNFHPYYKLKNNIQGFSTHTKKSEYSLRLRRTSNLAQVSFSFLSLGKPAVHFFSFLQYLYFSVFHKRCAFQCFTETNGHRNNALNDICLKKELQPGTFPAQTSTDALSARLNYFENSATLTMRVSGTSFPDSVAFCQK